MDQNEQMRFFFEIHQDNPQEGPGDFASTRRAFSMCRDLPPRPRILDAGCGPGRQTVDLCRLTVGSITAVDFHQPYLEALKRRSQEKGLGERITALQGDMGHLPFQPGNFDLIWSEGAVYILGFKKGLETWRPLLRERGTIAVTELTWLQPDPPDDVKAFFEEAYPPMQGIEANLADLRAAGYETAGHFTLPESAWWDYYDPIEKRIGRLEEKYSKNRQALAVLEMERQEMDYYRRYAGFYGYVFYIGQAR